MEVFSWNFATLAKSCWHCWWNSFSYQQTKRSNAEAFLQKRQKMLFLELDSYCSCGIQNCFLKVRFCWTSVRLNMFQVKIFISLVTVLSYLKKGNNVWPVKINLQQAHMVTSFTTRPPNYGWSRISEPNSIAFTSWTEKPACSWGHGNVNMVILKFKSPLEITILFNLHSKMITL